MTRRDVLVPAGILLAWTLGIALASHQLAHVQRQAGMDMLLQEGRALFEQVTLALAWNAGHGGVYVSLPPAASQHMPADGHVALPDGRALVLVDPPTMARQLSALAQARNAGHNVVIYGTEETGPGHGANSRHSPDAWDREALARLTAGAGEHWGMVAQDNGTLCFRYMAPLVADASCSPCHPHHCAPNERCGVVRISLPAALSSGAAGKAIDSMLRWFLIIWLAGGVGLVAGSWLLLRGRRAALEAVRAKSDFLAAMNHELRTPLNGILGLTDLALAEAESDTQREYLQTTRQSTQRLLRLFTFMLEYARLDVRERKTGLGEPFSLDDCLGMLRHEFLPLARAKGLTLTMEVAPGVPPVLAGDMNMLAVAVSQLLDNAVKFTETGSVRLLLEVRACPFPRFRRFLKGEGAVCCLQVTVADTGPGIPKDLEDKLFTPFFQGDATLARKHAGVGLGLALARRLARAMGGDVVLRRGVAQGTTVVLTAQFALPE
ncbi:ATP-binding protein [Megalodesulfovibrio paquesii]